MRNRSILFVDDDYGIRNALERTLHNEPYQRLYASSAAEAKKIINEKDIHIIVSDLLMSDPRKTREQHLQYVFL